MCPNGHIQGYQFVSIEMCVVSNGRIFCCELENKKKETEKCGGKKEYDPRNAFIFD